MSTDPIAILVWHPRPGVQGLEPQIAHDRDHAAELVFSHPGSTAEQFYSDGSSESLDPVELELEWRKQQRAIRDAVVERIREGATRQRFIIWVRHLDGSWHPSWAPSFDPGSLYHSFKGVPADRLRVLPVEQNGGPTDDD